MGAEKPKYGLVLPKAAPKQPAHVAAVKAVFSIDDEVEDIRDVRQVMLKAQSARAQQVRSAACLSDNGVS